MSQINYTSLMQNLPKNELYTQGPQGVHNRGVPLYTVVATEATSHLILCSLDSSNEYDVGSQQIDAQVH